MALIVNAKTHNAVQSKVSLGRCGASEKALFCGKCKHPPAAVPLGDVFLFGLSPLQFSGD